MCINNMERITFICCLLFFLASCSGGKKEKTETVQTAPAADSMVVVSDEEPDSLIVVEEVIPTTADESFIDFFYNFATDEVFQRSRILFPLPLYSENQVERVMEADWKYDPLFSQDGIYNVLFDIEEEMELEKDTSSHSVQIDQIFLKERAMKRYYFERKHDSWFLEALNVERMKKSESHQEEFYDFYSRFVTDSVFQRDRLNHPLFFVTADPEDDFEVIETTLSMEQWFAFRPPLLKNKLTNVRYGQKDDPLSSRKIVEYKGFGNGFNNVLHFHFRQGMWKLYKFEDLSD